MMDCKFNPTGSTIAISGENTLRYLHCDDLGHYIYMFEAIKSETAVSTLAWITDDIIACGFIDGSIQVGSFKSKDVTHKLMSKEMIK